MSTSEIIFSVVISNEMNKTRFAKCNAGTVYNGSDVSVFSGANDPEEQIIEFSARGALRMIHNWT